MAPADVEGKIMPRMPLPINTFSRRRDEVMKWKYDPWFEILYKLESSLSTIDRDYEIIQIKEKFGHLRFYIHSDSHRHAEMNELISKAEFDAAKIVRFKSSMVPPPQGYEGFKW